MCKIGLCLNYAGCKVFFNDFPKFFYRCYALTMRDVKDRKEMLQEVHDKLCLNYAGCKGTND
ncbi:hypothetical protein JCM21531_4262 [Acetivibrio straminisolvens JCM 21531]|uniref:Uncharacterized protein n=1 Tax=Acetivibrio straminisolvens JCM 21531 TaxID=1294263 RepID=W4VD03_9FIRM|nr:hypothetical protein JCM21531_4262 [Acetivibrio straminisolvens JCM 21531]